MHPLGAWGAASQRDAFAMVARAFMRRETGRKRNRGSREPLRRLSPPLSEHPLHADYQRMLDGGTKPNLAKLTLARKVASIVLAMWKHQEVYDTVKHNKPSS